jgi:hypothetical protein
MAWVHVPGLAGNVYVPDDTGQVQKKHPCKGCFSCQWCDENRCRVCRCDRTEMDGPWSRKRYSPNRCQPALPANGTLQAPKTD